MRTNASVRPVDADVEPDGPSGGGPRDAPCCMRRRR